MIDWTQIKHFKKSAFPENPDLHAEPMLIESLDAFRDIVGVPIYPSPVSGALARFSGSEESRHYAVGRRSDAVDVFVDCDIREAWMAAFRSKLWGGIGVYFDTHFKNKPWCMLHLDMRPGTTTYWFRQNKSYGHPMVIHGDMLRLFGLFNAL